MIRNGVRIPLKDGPPAPFHQGVSMEDPTPDQLRFMDGELACFLASGAWEEGHCSPRVSRPFLVPKPARPGDYMLSMGLHDDFYAIGIAPEDREYFTIDYRGKLYRLAGLPMGWSVSPYYLCSLTAAFNHHMRRPDFTVTTHGVRRSKVTMGRRQAPRSHFRGCRMLPDMEDFMFFAPSKSSAGLRRARSHHLSTREASPQPTARQGPMGLEHLGMEFDSQNGQFMFLAIMPAQFYLLNYDVIYSTLLYCVLLEPMKEQRAGD
eukprot:jgi/Tetstr1/457051/TSEL_043714.t1